MIVHLLSHQPESLSLKVSVSAVTNLSVYDPVLLFPPEQGGPGRDQSVGGHLVTENQLDSTAWWLPG